MVTPPYDSIIDPMGAGRCVGIAPYGILSMNGAQGAYIVLLR